MGRESAEELVIKMSIRVSEAVQEAEIDEQINERVLVGNGLAIAKNRTLDAESFGLRVDALDGGALVVDEFVSVAGTVEGVAEAGTDAGGHLGSAATGLPEFVMNRANVGSPFGMQERANIFATFMFDQTRGAVGEGKFEGHG